MRVEWEYRKGGPYETAMSKPKFAVVKLKCNVKIRLGR